MHNGNLYNKTWKQGNLLKASYYVPVSVGKAKNKSALCLFEENENTDNYRCCNCEYYSNIYSEQKCKRIPDHNIITFAAPWFKSNPEDFGMICSDFKPARYMKYALRHWNGFGRYYRMYKQYHLPYRNENKLVYFCINNNKKIRYGVPFLSYVYGTHIKNRHLFAVEKMYYKMHKVSKKYPTGYELVHETILGGVDF